MCFGGSQPQAPSIVYQGPSEADVAANQASLDQYRTQALAQQDAFSQQLQQQIDAANTETESLKAQYSTELSRIQQQEQDRITGAEGQAAADVAAAGAAGAAQQVGAYAVTTTQSEPIDGAQTTAAKLKKEKPKGSLKISTAALPSASGTGLNIGV